MAIIPKKKSKRKVDPHYLLEFNYMIGDANGYTSEEIEVSLGNPYLERVFTLINSLKPIKGRWGVMLELDRIYESYKEGQITEDDYNFLEYVLFEEVEEDHPYYKKDDHMAWQFPEGVRSTTEYSFLTLEDLKLFQISHTGAKTEMKVV